LKIYFGADHAGFELKEKLKEYAKELSHEVIDLGNSVFDENDDYPDFIIPVAKAVASNPNSVGVIVGGSGQGEGIAANKVDGVRAAVIYGPVVPKQSVDASGRQSTDGYEIAKLVRMHNHTNVLSLGARFLTEEEAKQILDIWLKTEYDVRDRYERRIKLEDVLIKD
jgi:ribose 5-phosphate isomerase B